jgi:hypothetical protein
MFKLQDDIIENTEFRRANHYEKWDVKRS